MRPVAVPAASIVWHFDFSPRRFLLVNYMHKLLRASQELWRFKLIPKECGKSNDAVSNLNLEYALINRPFCFPKYIGQPTRPMYVRTTKAPSDQSALGPVYDNNVRPVEVAVQNARVYLSKSQAIIATHTSASIGLGILSYGQGKKPHAANCCPRHGIRQVCIQNIEWQLYNNRV